MAISEKRQMSLDKKANQLMAILLPLVEAAGIGYATYVIIYLISIQYLINPPSGLQVRGIKPRPATGIGLIVGYCVLLLALGITFLRLLQVIWVNPGVVKMGEKREGVNAAQEKEGRSTKYFDRLDAYICDYQGWPLWCEKCQNWKPDRTHHSSQLGRCVRRMDHFCPYAGGIISETSHKFFVQFLFYGFLYTGYVLIVMAIFLAERKRELNSTPATWIVAICLSAMFFLFTFGMFLTTFYNMAINYTTVEVLQRGNVYNIALLKPKTSTSSTPYSSASSSPNSNSNSNSNQQSPVLCELQRSQSRSYIVVQTQPGDNPWDMGAWNNVRSIMGDSLIGWFIPWTMSPIAQHNSHEGEFGWGTVVQKMMEEHGAGSKRSRRRSRGSRSESRTEPRHV